MGCEDDHEGAQERRSSKQNQILVPGGRQIFHEEGTQHRSYQHSSGTQEGDVGDDACALPIVNFLIVQQDGGEFKACPVATGQELND